MLGACRARLPLAQTSSTTRRINLRWPSGSICRAPCTRLFHSTDPRHVSESAPELTEQQLADSTSAAATPAVPNHVPAGAPSNRLSAFAETMYTRLERALDKEDLALMVRLLSQLQDRLTTTPGTLEGWLYSRLRRLIRRALRTPPDGLCRRRLATLDKLAVKAAVFGDFAGVVARMAHYLAGRQPDAVLALARSLGAALHGHGQGPAPAGGGAVRERVVFLAGVPRASRADSAIPLVKAYAVAACVMKDSLAPLLGLLTLDGKNRPNAHALFLEAAAVATEYGLPGPKMDSWARRYHVLAVVALPLRRYKDYVSRLCLQAEQGRADPLRRFAAGIVYELSCADSGLRLSAADAAADAATAPGSVVNFTAEHWAFLVGSLVRANDEQATRAFEEGMQKVAGTVPPQVHAALVAGLGAVGRLDEMQRVWETMGSEGRTADVYCAYLHSLFRAGRTDDALAQFNEYEKDLRSTDSTPGPAATAVFNRVIAWLADAGRIEEAQAVLERMKNTGPAPDVASYNALLRGHLRRGDSGAVQGLLDELDARGLADDLDTAALRLTALHRTRPDAPALVLARLHASGMRDMRRACTALLAEHVPRVDTDGALDGALALLAHLDGVPALRPTADTFAAALYAAERRVWADGAHGARVRAALRADMAARGVQLHPTHVRHAINACRRNGTPDALGRALEYYLELRARTPSGRTVNRRVWSTLMVWLVERREWGLADVVARDMRPEATTSGMRALLEMVERREAKWGGTPVDQEED